MTIEFKCLNCNKRFYVTGTAEKALRDLVDAVIELENEGYTNNSIGAWKIIQNRAKCCPNPSIFIVKWTC